MVQIIPYDILEFFAFRIRKFGITVSGQIHQVPAVIDKKMIHQLGLAGSSGGHRQFAVSGQHVYQ